MTLFSDRFWANVDFRNILYEELAPFDPERIFLSGPNVDVQPSQALALSMIIHELATNAVKYGAFSINNGSIAVKWRTQANRLNLDWTERDGPKTEAPHYHGFGYVLIKGQVEQQLNGTLDTHFGPQGLSVRIDFPL